MDKFAFSFPIARADQFKSTNICARNLAIRYCRYCICIKIPLGNYQRYNNYIGYRDQKHALSEQNPA